MLMVRRRAITATTPTTRMTAQLTAITALNGSTAVSSSASARGTDVDGAMDTAADGAMDVADTATVGAATVMADADMSVDAKDMAA